MSSCKPGGSLKMSFQAAPCRAHPLPSTRDGQEQWLAGSKCPGQGPSSNPHSPTIMCSPDWEAQMTDVEPKG